MCKSVSPLTLIKSLLPIHHSESIDLVVSPITLEDVSIQIVIRPFALFFPHLKLSFVPLGTGRYPDTLPIELIIFPLSQINITRLILKNSRTVSFAILQLSLVCGVKLASI
jgi:hypothetical protein